jgi:hypothetical protein
LGDTKEKEKAHPHYLLLMCVVVADVFGAIVNVALLAEKVARAILDDAGNGYKVRVKIHVTVVQSFYNTTNHDMDRYCS